MKEKIKELLNIKEEEIKKFKISHKGYEGDCYILFTQNNSYFIKKYYLKDEVNYVEGLTAKKLFDAELKSINLLSTIKNEGMITPELVTYDSKNLILVQKYLKGEKFYNHLIKNCNKIYFNANLKNIFFYFGQFLAEYHNKFFYKEFNGEPLTRLHGDLSSHNMTFMRTSQIFLFDPSVIQGSIYIDLAKAFLIFYPLNFFLNFIIRKSKMNLLKNFFFEGYMKNSKFRLDKNILKKYIISKLDDEKRYSTQTHIYKLKKILINSYINHLIKKIEENKINIFE